MKIRPLPEWDRFDPFRDYYNKKDVFIPQWVRFRDAYEQGFITEEEYVYESHGTITNDGRLMLSDSILGVHTNVQLTRERIEQIYIDQLLNMEPEEKP